MVASLENPDAEKKAVSDNSRPHLDEIFTTQFDLVVPGLLLSAIIICLGTLFHAESAALVAIAVFFLGVVPQIKTKRADLLVLLDDRFSALASDSRALAAEAEPDATESNPERLARMAANDKAAHAFYLSFWNLQSLEFGLWRYGMIPSSTYAHWVVRRLMSFRNKNEERYHTWSPVWGWRRVKGDFIGTDFHLFMEVAVEIGLDVQKKHGTVTQSETSYRALHLRIARLLVKIGGGGLLSTFLVRSFSTQRTSLTKNSKEAWSELTVNPLMREYKPWRYSFLILSFLTVLGAYAFSRSFGSLQSDERVPFAIGDAWSSPITMGPTGPVSKFVIVFEQEGSCVPGVDSRRWRGADPSSASRAFVRRIARGLAACSKTEHRVRLEVVGFASSSEFRSTGGCGAAAVLSDQANLELANARAVNVARLLAMSLRNGEIDTHSWERLEDMERDREFVDRVADGQYNLQRGDVNRRVEIRVWDTGSCDPNL